MTNQTSITIIGGGFCGATIAALQTALYQEHPARKTGDIHIRVIEKADQVGGGVAYETDSDALLLNQPAYAMSPFPQDKDHFTKWLQARYHRYCGDDFAPRRLYGAYLKDIFRQATGHGAQTGIHITHLRATALDVDYDRATCQFSVKTSAGCHESNAVIIAHGHDKGDFLADLQTHPRYFDSPPDHDRLARLTFDAQDQLLIAGTGQSMVDALALLDAKGFDGTIWACSGKGILPWACDPSLYRVEKPPYALHYLSPGTIRAHQATEPAALHALLDKEIERAAEKGYGVAHVATAFERNNPAHGLPSRYRAALDDLAESIATLYRNPTPPERHRMIRDYLARGTLRILKQKLTRADLIPHEQGFSFRRGSLFDTAIGSVAALFNGASFAKAPCDPRHGRFLSGLLQSAADKGLLCPLETSGALTAGQQAVPGLFVAGPATRAGKWGVETFRDDNLTIARQSLDHALVQRPNPLPNPA